MKTAALTLVAGLGPLGLAGPSPAGFVAGDEAQSRSEALSGRRRMKRRVLLLAAPLGASLILAGPSSAGFLGLTTVHKPNPYALTWSIYAQFDEREGDFVFAVVGTPMSPLQVNVVGGTFYQHPLNGLWDGPPYGALCDRYPSFCYDTFVTIGKKTGQPGAITFRPNWPGFGPDRLEFDDSGWFVTPDDPVGNPNANNQVLLMQLSSQDGAGFFGSIVVAGFSNGVAFQSYVGFDTQEAPAPGSVLLLGAAGLPGRRRRRTPSP
jgi:MYXO-CTERM domain-containing protein